MRALYRLLANLIALAVVVQAGAIAWASFGLTRWVREDGGVVDRELLDCVGCAKEFPAQWGFPLHEFVVGMVVIPSLALLLVLASFRAKIRGGVVVALALLLLVAVQIAVLPELAEEVDALFGAAHGVNALLIMGLAMMAAGRARKAKAASSGTGEPTPDRAPAPSAT